MSIKILVEHQTLCIESDVIGIGRDPDNLVAFPNDLRIAPIHAIIRLVNGRWIVEASDGHQVRIGGGRPTRFAWLNHDDVILLTAAGPEIVFDPSPAGPAESNNRPIQAVPAFPPRTTDSVSKSVIPKRFVPDSNNNVDESYDVPTLGSSRKKSRKKVKEGSKVQPHTIRALSGLVIGLTSIMTVFVVGWIAANWTVRPSQSNSPSPIAAAENVDSRESVDVKANLNLPTETKMAIDPREFLVLVGIGDLKTSDRPHVLGVGWLWDDRTVVASRDVGEAIIEVTAEAQSQGVRRQGCAIQGVPYEVEEIRLTEASSGLSILRLTESTGLPLRAREQWARVDSKEIERQRHLGKSLTYYSFEPLERAPQLQGEHNFPLCEYDPDKCQMRSAKARLLFEQGKHFLESTEADLRLEHCGLFINDAQNIVGMTLPDSSIVWTATLENAITATHSR